MNRSMLMAGGLAAALFLAGCGGGSEAPKEESTAAPAAGGAMMKPDMAAGGTVEGKVMFTGKMPVMFPIDMSAKPECAKLHPGGVKSEDVVVNPDGSLANVFVYVKEGLPAGDWEVPSTPVEIDQQGCMYVPHVIGVMKAQDVVFKNSDTGNHNVHPIPANNQEWNESVAPNSSTTKQFPREEMALTLKCNIHPWMKAYINVMSHPFYATTGTDGSFSIKGLPPGEYTIVAWHEKYGTQEMKVKVDANGTGKADFTFKG